MFLKTNKTKQNMQFRLPAWSRLMLISAGCFFLFVYTCILLMIGGGWGFKAHYIGFQRLANHVLFSKCKLKMPLNYIKGLSSRPERLTIDIKHKNFLKIAHKQSLAVSDYWLNSSDEDYVPAQIVYKNNKYRIKMRLKGDATDHFISLKNKWSFKIKVRGNNTIEGMKTFSLNVPPTRDYIWDWLFYQSVKREGLITIRVDYVNLILNGKDLGVYVLEEHFDKLLIENNKRREGPIVRFDELSWWQEQNNMNDYINFDSKPPIFQDVGNYYSLPIDMFKTNKTLSDPVLREQCRHAIFLFDNFRRKKLKTSEVFDADQMAKFMALCDLFGGSHAIHPDQSRFYHNPITTRLEPIPFNPAAGTYITTILAFYPLRKPPCAMWSAWNESQDEFLRDFFEDEAFYKKYIAALERISEDSYLTNLLEETNDEMSSYLNMLYREYPYFYFQKDILTQNQKIIRKKLNPVSGVNGYFHGVSGNSISLNLCNVQPAPIEIKNISYKDTIFFIPSEEIILSGKGNYEISECGNYEFKIPETFTWHDEIKDFLTINYTILGSTQIKTNDVIPYANYGVSTNYKILSTTKGNYKKFDFLIANEELKTIQIKPGKWRLEENLIIPVGYTLSAGESVFLDLTNKASIISYSPILFIGSKENPVTITSSDENGQGIVILNANKKSVLKYVHFDSLSNPQKEGWELTGAVTFYESPVDIAHCVFMRNIRGDDYLNIIRAYFEMDNITFKNTKADAFDADFCTGNISNSYFVDSGNDSVDISGTKLFMNNIIIVKCGDKGLSAGEKSQIIVENIEIRDSEIAVCSKDSSLIVGKQINLQNNKIGFCAFQKKPEFGSSKISVSDVKMDKIEIPYLIEKGSKLTVNGKQIKSDNKKVKEILYGNEYGKASK